MEAKDSLVSMVKVVKAREIQEINANSKKDQHKSTHGDHRSIR